MFRTVYSRNNRSDKSICLTANAIKVQLGISLDEEEQYREFEVKRIGKNYE